MENRIIKDLVDKIKISNELNAIKKELTKAIKLKDEKALSVVEDKLSEFMGKYDHQINVDDRLHRKVISIYLKLNGEMLLRFKKYKKNTTLQNSAY